MKVRFLVFYIFAAALSFVMTVVYSCHAAGGASVAKIAYDNEWTTATLNPASLYDVYIPTGTIGDWTVCFDTASRGTHTAGSTDWLWKAVISSNTANNGGAVGIAPRPPAATIKATVGIGCISNSRNHLATILYNE